MWLFLDGKPSKPPQYLSWDLFKGQRSEEPCTSYLTEAGPRILDAALTAPTDIFHIGSQNQLVVETPIYASSLLALGLGRSSLLFAWAEEKQSFIPVGDAIRLSGCTGGIVESHAGIFINCGNLTKRLQKFVDEVYIRSATPGRVALADAVSTVLATLQYQLNVSIYSLRSVIRLQEIFRPAELLLSSFHNIVQSVAAAQSDEALLSRLFQEIQRLETASGSLDDIYLEVLNRISRPFLRFMGEWIGTRKETGGSLQRTGAGRSFVKIENCKWTDEQGMEIQEPDFILDSALVPSFLSAEDSQLMFETGRSLRFLREHHSDHPLAKTDIIDSANPPDMEWRFTWQSIEEVESKAFKYEKDLIAALKRFSSTTTTLVEYPLDNNREESSIHKFTFFGQTDEGLKVNILASIDSLNQTLPVVSGDDHLRDLLISSLENSQEASIDGAMFAPPISLTPLLSFGPIIAAQARIVNSTTMRLLFKQHNIREHLSILRQFQLLGNGVFSSRLSHSLFDPELETAERKAGVARTGGIVGLRLGGRDTWPPASSELRLALMGILTESYVFMKGDAKARSGSYLDRKAELPGDLSFAVRDMTDEEIEKCIDPHSMEALDFLRLSYKPPQPLGTVITPLCLYKYDQLFKILLRVVRMLFVVSQLFRDATDRSSYWQGIDPIAQRFRIETHHFVTCISSYFFDVGIDATWRIFERKLDKLDVKIDMQDEVTVLSQHEGLDQLRDYHGRVLDRIMFSLFLRKRQQPIMKLLEEIFTLILQFAKHSREQALGEEKSIGVDSEVKDMYLRFRKKVEVFITVCRGLSEKKGYGEKGINTSVTSQPVGLFDSEELEEENTIVQLVALLDMSNYYSNRKRT